MRILLLLPIAIIIIIFRLLNNEQKSEHQKYLERELEDNPDYINWLKMANNGRDYKLGIKILTKIKRDKNNSYKKWLKRVRKLTW